MNEPSPAEFYLGLLLALRAHRHTFVADGDCFHNAFGVLLAETMKIWKVARIMAEHFDPVFGVHRAAEDMILEGMGALLLSLDAPRMTTARFTIGAAQAASELDELNHAATYRELAQVFHRNLEATL